MASQKGILLWAVLGIIAVSCNSRKECDIDIEKQFAGLTIGHIDTMQIGTASVDCYKKITEYAMGMFQDTVKENHFKGEVLLARLSAHLSEEVKNDNLDTGDEEVRQLFRVYEKYQFYIYQPKVPDFLKLAHHACEGNYEYIYSRFKTKWYFIPSIVIVAAYLIFSVANLFGFVYWKYRKLCNVLFLVLVGVVLAAGILFNKTCDQYVTQDSFFGIHL
ncbi:hypothetical protein OCK74_19985 [Chitinophagaceae bacterium LB-8]|uniref:Uncharacterized protein n=1 Tax=Paraflavisolibacter caeni TaxID=2982496 RepID=A0A9X2XPI4_9BACT|nr:hypothetical protein [Paraflavisolibacter caeni]MCU7551413.1 hypothetical protein [Paraflavisolibacter caeni]